MTQTKIIAPMESSTSMIKFNIHIKKKICFQFNVIINYKLFKFDQLLLTIIKEFIS